MKDRFARIAVLGLTVALHAAFCGQAVQAQTIPNIQIPAPPKANVDFSRMHYGSSASQPPPFRVEFPPAAQVQVTEKDLASLSPVTEALRQIVEAAVRDGARKRTSVRTGRDGRKYRRQVALPASAELVQLARFYAARNFAPVWRSSGRWSRASRSIMTRLQRAGEDGFELKMTLPVLGAQVKEPTAANASLPLAERARTLALAEFQLSRAVVRYARYARGGRVNPAQISSLIAVSWNIPEAKEILDDVSKAEFAGDRLHDYNPPHAGYRALRAKLAEIRARSKPKVLPPIAHGRTLRVGMRDARVPLIRLRFGLSASGDEAKGEVYDTRVASAVARFQRQRGLPASGRLTRATIRALSDRKQGSWLSEVVANMERWRWLPRELGSTHVWVNVPEYRARVFRNGQEVHSTRVIVGKPANKTPVFSDEMELIVVNPSWNVPLSIIKNEMLPAFARNPEYFSRRGYEVKQVGNRLFVRQPPGPRNALGYVKFLFPNRHSVYMHDTPSRGLFNASRRAFSHGCIRVQYPFKFAGAVLAGQRSGSERQLRRMIGGSERTIRLQDKIPVHIVYFTVSLDENGVLQRFGDIYGHSARLRQVLALDNR